MNLQQEGDLGLPVEPLLVGSQPPQDVLVAGEVLPGSRYGVEFGAAAAPTAQTVAGGRPEVGGEQVAMTAAAEEHDVLQLRGILGNLGEDFKSIWKYLKAFYRQKGVQC